MTTTTERKTNKRGDVVALVVERHDFYIGAPTTIRAEVTFAIVTSVTRDGAVKAVRGHWGNVGPVDKSAKVMSVPCPEPQALYEAARAHTWPGHPNQPKAFDSIAEAAEFARPYCQC